MNTNGQEEFEDFAELPRGEEILKYLIQHPEAQDTVQGIAEWWMAGRSTRDKVAEVKVALDDLIRKGFVIARPGKDGRAYYRLNRAQEQAIRTRLTRSRSTRKRRSE